jgi:branched-chain amino acid transport system ATP-binding protein
MACILKLKDLTKSFGALVVSEDLSFALDEGKALGVIGPNGAGKTTMFNLVTGTLRADGGDIEFAGQNINGLSPSARARAGIARSFQVPQPFSGMSVFENTLVAATTAAGMDVDAANRHCLDVLDRIGLVDKANQPAGSLTLLERKQLELARALSAKPKLLLLDEIAGGLTEHECRTLVSTIRDIRQTGITIIWIEHIVHALLAVVDRLLVLDFGRKIADGDPQAVMADETVRATYMGIEADG